MEDDNGLELSLGLSCGTSSATSKSKIGSSSDNRTEEGNRGIKIGDDFKNFLQAGTQKQDPNVGSQRIDPVKPSENFFTDLSKAAGDAEASVNLNGRGFLGTKNNRSAEIDEEKWSEAVSKRKMLFDEINNPKKLEREAHYTDLHENSKTSHISPTTEDGSTAENEDVAESEVEGSTLRMVSHHDDGSKRFIGVSGSSEVPKEVKLGILNYGNPFPVQSANAMNVPFLLPMKDSNSVGTPSSSGHTLPGMIKVMPTGNNEQSGTQTANPGNLPFMFGYSPVQLPLLDKDNSWGMVSHPPQFHPSYASRAPPNPDKHSDGLKISQASMHTIVCNSSEAAQYEGRTFERVKGEGKQHATEEGSSTQSEEDVKGSSMNLRANAASDQPTEGLSLDISAIKPGIAADLKFGGSGSYPNLPWVSTTGTDPQGRTISGVTYRFSANQIKIVCACHGTHMSPEEFVRHASEECANPENNNGLSTFPSTNPAASAQS
ncbi:ninja-family protein mc410-like [Durio zibethinus]|uniref:Ninja-family protein n=1 Tax=Durio zibethinus TaxID=66656 RepID=A0A6P5ZBK4_DURZI|nr:ninja-family protein mc410-like [Durio zibethinus]XP_022749842.1 ninja-family protein mc410-like [Durio zibethinus]